MENKDGDKMVCVFWYVHVTVVDAFFLSFVGECRVGSLEMEAPGGSTTVSTEESGFFLLMLFLYE